MKIPKNIERAIEARRKAADKLLTNDLLISEFIQKHNIDCEMVNLHCMVIAESYTAAEMTREAILAHQE